MRRSTYFYATPADFQELMDLVKADEDFVYLVHPDIHSPEVQDYDHAHDIPDVLRMFPGHFTHDLFLVPPGTTACAASHGHATGTRYSLRPRELASAVVLQLCGEHPDGPLLRSRFYLHGTAPETRKLEATLFRHMRRSFRDVGGAKVGPEAFGQLLIGRRLTFDVKAPREADLRVSGSDVS
ncbi:hypothetical protein AQS8620_02658 [Aquimixticola soesokkakensis]|uniref:Uncharacterized protein n=1 Tax=Aquimixticola soesokkakensis TaxID=1519096 RepID=A0A1Y5TAA3_9RHOB|nr:hypothetical protein [Aquimixticola soesokkakensis]SLN59548.1 hypothetical protein AQS8620_02658 [Aquimixticola soesokkakensis]